MRLTIHTFSRKAGQKERYMGNYRNFELATYFVAHGTEHATWDALMKDIDFFEKYMRLDKVYIEAYRDGSFADEDQVRLVKEVFEERGIRTEGGITTCVPTPEGDEPKQRLFNTFCYNDDKMLDRLDRAVKLTAKVFDAFIIDDFYFTNCTCEKCRAERDAFNKANSIFNGSWEKYRVHKMYEVSEQHMIAPAKEVNPDCKITIKYPNWMESYQETGYDPLAQRGIFDAIYTGTETRDPRHQDQHLPRYLSYSLMRYLEDMAPGRNGGGWFDPFDCQITEYYLEQAYLTAFAKSRELMMFCFQALVNSMNVPALGFQLDKLDELLDNMGTPIGIPCYIPDASQGEDNIQDFLGMNGFPVVTTPFFPENAPTILLTASSYCDKDIVAKLEKFVSDGGKAVVTSGFMRLALKNADNANICKSLTVSRSNTDADCCLINKPETLITCMTSIRDRQRSVTVKNFFTEYADGRRGMKVVKASEPFTFPVMEFRNNATWAALCKGVKDTESYTLLARDTYGKGQLITLVIPDSFPEIGTLPEEILSRMRAEFKLNGIWFEGEGNVSIFPYDNDTFILYNYVSSEAYDTDLLVHIKGAASLKMLNNSWWGNGEIKPLYNLGDEAVFRIRAAVGKYAGYKINR